MLGPGQATFLLCCWHCAWSSPSSGSGLALCLDYYDFELGLLHLVLFFEDQLIDFFCQVLEEPYLEVLRPPVTAETDEFDVDDDWIG